MTYASDPQTLLRQGIAAVKAGQTAQARQILMQVVEMDETNAPAWLWLSAVMDDLTDKFTCLHNVLTLEPDNRHAQIGLARLEQQLAAPQPPTTTVEPAPAKSSPPPIPAPAASPPIQPSPPLIESPPPPVYGPPTTALPTTQESQPARDGRSGSSQYKPLSPTAQKPTAQRPGHLKEHASVAAALLQDHLAGRLTPEVEAAPGKPAHLKEHHSDAAVLLKEALAARRPAPEPKEEAPKDVFANDYVCPYCAVQTQADDKKCPKCGQKLWLSVPRLSKPSTLYKRMRLLYTIGFIFDILQLGLVFVVVTLDNSTRIGSAAFVLSAVSMVVMFRLLILIGLYGRWRIIFYLYLINSVLGLAYIGAVVYMLGLAAGFISVPMLTCGGFLAFLGIGQFFMALNLGDDFTFDKYRVLTQVDPGLKSGLNLLERGRGYANRKMWAKAAMHFRRAAYQMSESIEPQLSLAVAFINLKMYDQAVEPLHKAKALEPFNPKIEKMEALLAQQRRAV